MTPPPPPFQEMTPPPSFSACSFRNLFHAFCILKKINVALA
jgi:hypothetical protein